DRLEAAGDAADDERLEEAVTTDRLGQRGEGLLVEVPPRLVGGRHDLGHRPRALDPGGGCRGGLRKKGFPPPPQRPPHPPPPTFSLIPTRPAPPGARPRPGPARPARVPGPGKPSRHVSWGRSAPLASHGSGSRRPGRCAGSRRERPGRRSGAGPLPRPAA